MARPIVFDAYGTLFDVYSVSALADELFPGAGARIAELWRVAQIDYTRLYTLSGRYRDFWQITQDALDFALEKAGVAGGAAARQQLLAQYERLTAFPENPDVLTALKSRGHVLAILSNGTPAMLDSALTAAGMTGLFAHVLSVDTARRFKTAPEAYRLATDCFGLPPAEMIFVSSNGWDVCGAAWFGFRTFWVNRAGNVLDRLGVTPDGEGRDLRALLPFAGQE